MVVFPNCKINLGLRVTKKRTDGYHDLETVFYPLPFCDALEIVGQKETTTSINFTATGNRIETHDNNLCIKAYELLAKEFASLPGFNIHLHKAIPISAGLGGGSADAAFTLKAIDKIAALDLSEDDLIAFALKLGSDCPFFIINSVCYATGRGEMLEKIELDLSSYQFVLVNPGIHISTGKMFAEIKPTVAEQSIKEIIYQPVITWKNNLINDFEPVVFSHYPAIKEIKDELYHAGAIYASMSGSGSTVFGIFNKEVSLSFNFPNEYFVKTLVS